MSEPAEVVIDATGLRCPLPVTHLADALAEVPVGHSVMLLATDPSARVDVPVWCRLHRHRLRSVAEDGDQWSFRVVRAH
ncbi:MAG: sulfurtransferase TusA family protein [Nitriliruptoraceae bacterium]